MQFQLTREFLDQLRSSLQSSSEQEVISLVGELHAADIAEIVEELEIEEAKILYSYLDAEKASEVLINIDEDIRDKHIAAFTSKQIAEIFIENLESDDAADVIAVLPQHEREEVIACLEDQEQAEDIVDLLNFQEGTAGALMGKELVEVNENWSVKQCIREMRKQAENVDHIYTIYVVDDHEKLLGRLSLKKILTATADKKIADIYETGLITCKTYTPSDEVANLMEKYDLVALPVLDELGRLVGRITIDDVVDVIREEAEKDYQMASGLSDTVDSSDSIWVNTRARLPWLVLGLIGGIFGARVIGLYEEDLQIMPQMAFFIPLIAAMGGNVGVQSSAIIVQGLANNSLGMGGIGPKLSKEFSVALFNGFVCASLILCYNLIASDSLVLSYTVSISLFAVILFAALFGTLVPLLLNKYKIDPALATGPFITTVNDILGLFIYFIVGRMLYLA
jgi:magnesium transporter